MRQLETAAQPRIEMPREELALQQDQQPEDVGQGRPGELLGKRGSEDIEGAAVSEEEARLMQQRAIQRQERDGHEEPVVKQAEDQASSNISSNN